MKSPMRQLLEVDRDYLNWLFDGRCAKCGGRGAVIHEIIPISHGEKSLHYTNRIKLCNNCHDWAHRVGTNVSIPVLQEFRKLVVIRKFGSADGENQEAYQQSKASESQLSEPRFLSLLQE